MAKKVPKSVAEVQRILFEFFPDAEPEQGLDFRFLSTVDELRERGMAGEKQREQKATRLSEPGVSMADARFYLPPLKRTEPGVVKVADVARAMYLMTFRGPIKNLAKLYKKRVSFLKRTLFGEGAMKAGEKALAKKIQAEAAKEMFKKLGVVKAALEAASRAREDEDTIRAAASLTVGEFIAQRLARPSKFTRFTRWERSRK